MPSPTFYRHEIAAIDRKIDANRRGANDKAIETALFRERGVAQLHRDQADEAARVAAARRPYPKMRCPTCGHVSFVLEA